MTDDDRDDAPSLEPPSLGFGFGRKKKKQQEPVEAPAGTDDTPTQAIEDAPTAEDAPVAPPAPPEEPVAEPVSQPASQPARQSAVTAPVPSPAAPTAPPPGPAVSTGPGPLTEQAGDEGPGAPAADAEHEPRAPWTDRIPVFAGRQAAAITGLLIGLLIVAATALSLRACDLVRGTATCGGGPGFLLLVATMIVSIYVGGMLLRLWGEPDPGSTSFLAVGLIAVVSLLFFIDVLMSAWMIVVIPLVAVGAYLLSHWVTTTFIEPAEH